MGSQGTTANVSHISSARDSSKYNPELGTLLGPSRRSVLFAAATIGAGVFMSPNQVLAQSPPAMGGAQRRRIDIHHHFFPPPLLDAMRDGLAKAGQPTKLFPPMEKWTATQTLEEMASNNVATAILSISSGLGARIGLDIDQSRSLARRCNEYAAEMIREHPGRFGLFACIPMPDADGALREIEYAFDTLNADGIGMLTSYAAITGAEVWPGDPTFVPVFDELNRRKAIVFYHLGRIGSSGLCCGNVVPSVPDVMTETPQDMTRALTSLLFSGTLSRCPDIRFIFSNAGGTVPMLAGRMEGISKSLGDDFKKLVPRGIAYELKKQYYDVSNAANNGSLAAVSQLVPASQILFGSDFPYAPVSVTKAAIDGFSFTDAQLDEIYQGNAVTLLPRLKA